MPKTKSGATSHRITPPRQLLRAVLLLLLHLLLLFGVVGGAIRLSELLKMIMINDDNEKLTISNL